MKEQVRTERGFICVVAEFSSPEEAEANGYSYSFTSKEIGCDVYGKCLDDRGLRHEFVLIRGGKDGQSRT